MRRTEPASSLLLATFVAMLLALAAALLMMNTRAARAASAEALRDAKARFTAQRLMAIGLITLDSDDPIPSVGVVFQDPVAGQVSRQDAAGLVDINAAAPETLDALLSALGVEADRALVLADRIADWRDEDSLRRPRGAEAEEYRSAHVRAPANRPFRFEEEISLVLGIDSLLARCLARYTTTSSGLAEIDAGVASPPLRALLNLPAAQDERTAPLGGVVLLTAEMPISEQALLRRLLWVRRTGNDAQPFLVHRASEEFAPRADPPSRCGVAS